MIKVNTSHGFAKKPEKQDVGRKHYHYPLSIIHCLLLEQYLL